MTPKTNNTSLLVDSIKKMNFHIKKDKTAEAV
jgi:hypothetical protein